ncbi:MAG TPA: CapA family protein [Gaiellaceae bacterium]|nr:CapA family protein [Gaiellaceae bacterium]
MARTRRRRAAAAAGLCLLAAGAAAALAPLLGPRGAVAAAAPPLRVTGNLPEWRAPGAPFVVTGWAGRRERVELRAGGRRIAGATAGRLGRFTLRVRAPLRAGRYALALRTPARRLALRPLVVRPVTLAAAGDVNLGDRIGAAIAVEGADAPWRAVAPLLRAADVAVVNLECAVSTRGSPSPKEYVFRGAPHALHGAARAGVDAVSVANNHAFDFGVEAFLDTLRHARAAGIAPFGGGADLGAARRPVILERGGLRIALLGYSDVRPLGVDAAAGKPGTARADTSWIAADVRAARRRADVVVVYFHWGVELSRQPDARQRTFADAALAAGASVVLGAHPHVLQPVERRGRRAVAWSLGNFVFGAASPGTTDSGILLLRLGGDGVRGVEFVPARIDGFTPVPDTSRARAAVGRMRRDAGVPG